MVDQEFVNQKIVAQTSCIGVSSSQEVFHAKQQWSQSNLELGDLAED